jgi:hypothetical protein
MLSRTMRWVSPVVWPEKQGSCSTQGHGAPGKGPRLGVALLAAEAAEIDGGSAEARRGAGFHAAQTKAQFAQMRRQSQRGELPGPARLDFELADVNQAV